MDVTGLAGISVASVMLAFVFRTLWRQDSGWQSLLAQERSGAAAARSEAEEARDEARIARQDAAAARAEASIARQETLQCQIEHESTNIKLAGLVAHLRTVGIPIPRSVLNPDDEGDEEE